MIRLAMGESTQRSELDDRHLTARLREVAVEQLEQVPEEEVWLIADSSDLRKPSAEMMPYLMQVPDLEGVLVPDYRTINVIGVTPGRRGLLYHHLFCSQAPDDVARTGRSPRGSGDGQPGPDPSQRSQDDHLAAPDRFVCHR